MENQVQQTPQENSAFAAMRRAKERVLYDSYIAMIGAGSMASQRLLFPERLTLTDEDYALLAEQEVEFVLTAVVAREALVAHHLHTGLVAIEVLDEPLALLHREQTSLLAILADGNNDAVENLQSLLHQRLVATGEWVERPGEKCSFHTLFLSNV